MEYNVLKVQNCDNFIMDNCNFGTNETRDFVVNFQSGISINQANSNFNSILNNNRFLSSQLAIEMNGGNAIINNNLFGVLDRSRAINFLSPKSAIKFGEMNQVKIDSNSLMDYRNVSIECKDFIIFIEVKNNKFVRCSINTIELNHPDIYADIHHSDINSNENFLYIKNCNALKVDSNIVNLVSSFIVIDSIKEFQLFQHLGNQIQCTMNESIINPNVISPTINE